MTFIVDLLSRKNLFEPEEGVVDQLAARRQEYALSRPSLKDDVLDLLAGLWYLSAAELSIPGVLLGSEPVLRQIDRRRGLQGRFYVLRRNLDAGTARAYCTLVDAPPECFGIVEDWRFDRITIFSSDSVRLRRVARSLEVEESEEAWSVAKLAELVRKLEQDYEQSPLLMGRELAQHGVIRFQGLLWIARAALLFSQGRRAIVEAALDDAIKALGLVLELAGG